MSRFLLFLIINFSALAIGTILMGSSPGNNTWYQQLHKAPWTPPGWVFGAAWFSIMLCFSFFMYYKTRDFQFSSHRELIILFILQWFLNATWNSVFFNFHFIGLALIMIMALTILVAIFTWQGFKQQTYLGLLMLPYFVWLMIATSLNVYVYLKNN